MSSGSRLIDWPFLKSAFPIVQRDERYFTIFSTSFCVYPCSSSHQADPGQLKDLLKLLKLSPAQQSSVSLATLPPPKMADVEKPKTRLVVKSRGEYPLRGFPSSLERFEAVGEENF